MTLLRQRREMRSNMVDATSDVQFQEICLQLTNATRRAKQLRKQTFEAKREMLIEELWEQWHARRFAECNKLLKTLGARKSGPKRRAYTTLRRALPTQDEWLSVWSLPGPQGGMNVEKIDDWTARLNEHVECAEAQCPLPDMDMNFVEQAKMDVKRLRSHVIQTGKRKTCPIHSQPAAVLLIALAPNTLKNSKAQKMYGIGSPSAPLRAPCTYRAFLKGYATSLQTGQNARP